MDEQLQIHLLLQLISKSFILHIQCVQNMFMMLFILDKIGFYGTPWTVLAYMVEEGSSIFVLHIIEINHSKNKSQLESLVIW